MSLAYILVLLVLGYGAGMLGAIAGIGGGIIITPVLALYMGVPIQQAIGTSLVAVVTTSTASSSVHVQRHVTDIRLGITLELATTVGAVVAATLATRVNRGALGVLFAVFLLYSAGSILRRVFRSRASDAAANTGTPSYRVRRWGVGMAGSLVAGGLSGLLGIGGGPIKVPIMYLFMDVPLQVATATSNFMIGVTAAASAFVYYRRGDVLPLLAAPLLVGVFLGSVLGARLAPRIRAIYVQWILIIVMVYLALQMLVKVVAGKL